MALDVAARLLAPLVRAPEAPALLARTLNVALSKAGYLLPVRMWDETGGPATLN